MVGLLQARPLSTEIYKPDLNMLSLATKGSKRTRPSFIRHLWLRLKFAKYNCSECQSSESSVPIN